MGKNGNNLPVPFRRQVKELARQLWKSTTDGDGRLDKEAVIEALTDYLDNNPTLAGHSMIARLVVDEVDRETRPASDGRQSELFDRDRYIPTGPRERVRMEDATRIDVIRWGAVDDGEMAASMKAWTKKSEYRGARLTVWTDEYRTLGEIERAFFRHEAAG